MNNHHLVNLIVAVLLLAVAALTVREAAATTGMFSQTDRVSPSSGKCADLPSRYSIRSEYVQAMDSWVIVTEDGPTGIDGGLIQLLSDYRSCSK